MINSTKISAVFLAAVLVAGTIALSSPSIMRDVQAQRDYDGTYNNYEKDYGKDNNSYKSKDNKIVKKVNCNNIDVNVNGLELSGLPPALSGLAASETDEGGERDSSSYGSYGAGEQQSGYDNNKNSFKFVCINNNNNTVIGEEQIPEPDLACEECFAANSTLQAIIIDFIRGEGALTVSSFTEDNAGQLIVDVIVAGGQIDTIEELCNQIEKSTEFAGVPISDELIRALLEQILLFEIGSPEGFESSIEELIECLLEAGLIADRDFPPPPPDSLSANGLSSPNVQIANFGLN